MVRRFSSLFFRQSSQGNLARPAADNAEAGASHPVAPPNPLQRTDFPKKTVRHVKSNGNLLGTLRSLQYSTQTQISQPPLPIQSATGLGELQEFFWLEDNLHRTTSQLDRCSNQLDKIHGSAAEVRRELEGLQSELELLQKKMQNGGDRVKSEESNKESTKESPKPIKLASKPQTATQMIGLQKRVEDHVKAEERRIEPAKPAHPGPKQPVVVKTSNIQPNRVDEVKSQISRAGPPKPVDSVSRRPVIAKPSSIQQRIQFFSKIANS
ncbi:hypothetical protein KVR01_008312 [Diaporthe batatas]|uniref:uncharacterized protein n=1 Tax=Diaporthe batatas TaxID=748121 RepID=UPI001D05AD8E|nr:uncharacterized protein KVR01_008312 [Diaporthe batatas]KAG8162547.1 hypothetical protein KVR01_008312 [Diaporthe batatas]